MILKTIILCFVYGIIGIFLGLLVNMVSTQIIEVFKISRILKMFIQIMFCSIILGSIYASIPNMNELQGVFFLSTFFGVQYTMYSDIQHFVESESKFISNKIKKFI
jgi:hypothetical protein